jgi:hypothetical protein
MMFKLSDYFVKQEEAEATTAVSTDTATETTTETSETATSETSGDTLLTGESEKSEESTDTTDADQEEKQEEEVKAEVPEKYELTMPEGVELDSTLLDKATPVFQELGLTNDQANKLGTMFAEHQSAMHDQYINDWANQQKEWVTNLKADPDFGGSKFDANVSVAKQAIERFADDQTKQVLNETGMGNHPEFIKLFHRIGMAISEDGFSDGATTVTSDHRSLYKNSNMNP